MAYDEAELKQLRKIAKAARRVLETRIWGRGLYMVSAKYDKATDALDAALKAWEPEQLDTDVEP